MVRTLTSALDCLKKRIMTPGRIRPVPTAIEATVSGLKISAVLGNITDQVRPPMINMLPNTTLMMDIVFTIVSCLFSFVALATVYMVSR
jgi:hypothetical protein